MDASTCMHTELDAPSCTDLDAIAHSIHVLTITFFPGCLAASPATRGERKVCHPPFAVHAFGGKAGEEEEVRVEGGRGKEKGKGGRGKEERDREMGDDAARSMRGKHHQEQEHERKHQQEREKESER